MTAVVDQETCIGCGLCVETCPEVFKMIDGDKAVSKVKTVSAGLEDKCREAAENCPVSAITCQ
jgi:ferredoxin